MWTNLNIGQILREKGRERGREGGREGGSVCVCVCVCVRGLDDNQQRDILYVQGDTCT